MKKRNTYKLIYLFALILNLTLFKLSISYTSNPQEVIISAEQNDDVKLSSMNNYMHLEKDLSAFNETLLLSSEIRNATLLISSENLTAKNHKNRLNIDQLEPRFITAN